MAANDHHHAGHGHHVGNPLHHVTPISHYLGVFALLMVLTALTVWVAFQDFGALNTFIALGIAGLKTTAVMLIFMHLRHSTRLTWLVVVVSFVMVGILFVLTYSDYLTRYMSHL